MFTYQDKEMFLNELVAFAQNTECIAGLCQTGSGAGKNGYRDLFSHISASLFVIDNDDLPAAEIMLISFLKAKNTSYIHRNSKENQRILDIFWHGGMSAVIQLSLIEKLHISPEECKILVDKKSLLLEFLSKNPQKAPVSSWTPAHYEFCYALRRCEMQWHRGEYICAEMMLSEARKILLSERMAYEHKNLRFSQYNTLDPDFLNALYETYPSKLSEKEIIQAENAMLNLYLQTISVSEGPEFDPALLSLFSF